MRRTSTFSQPVGGKWYVLVLLVACVCVSF